MTGWQDVNRYGYLMFHQFVTTGYCSPVKKFCERLCIFQCLHTAFDQISYIYIKHTVSVSTTFSIGLLDHRTSVRTPPKCHSVSYLLVFLNYKLIIIINMPLVKKKVLVLVKKSCFKKETLVQLFGWNDFCHDYKQLKK